MHAWSRAARASVAVVCLIARNAVAGDAPPIVPWSPSSPQRMPEAFAPIADPLGNPADGEWRAFGPPLGRYGAGVVHDTRRNRLLVFGGSDQFQPFADLWALKLDGPSAWRAIRTDAPGPSPRHGLLAAYDARRDRLLVFGGATAGSSVLADAWQMDLGAIEPRWEPLVFDGPIPPPRAYGTIVVDPQGDRIVIFGGLDPEPLGDTWELELGEPLKWSRIDAAVGPGPRARSAAAWDAVGQRLVLFGGARGGQQFNDVWQLASDASGPVWSRLEPTGTAPTRRSGPVAMIEPARRAMLVFGGYDGAYRDDLFEYALDADRWTQVPIAHGAAGRVDAGGFFDPASGRVFVFGGFSSQIGFMNDVWSFRPVGSGEPLLVARNGSPPPRYGGQVVHETRRGRALILGGASPGGTLSAVVGWNDLGERGAAGTFRLTAGPGPGGRWAPVAVYDSLLDRVYAFGGVVSGGLGNDLWRYTGFPFPEWARVNPSGTAPAPSAEGAGVFDPVRRRFISHGGFSNSSAPISETWVLALEPSPRWLPMTFTGALPLPRTGHTAALDTRRDRMLIFGGTTSGSAFGSRNDVWALSLSGVALEWSRLTVQGPLPPRRQFHAMVYDPDGDRLIIHGGSDSLGAFLDDAWELTLAAAPRWRRIHPVGLPPGGLWGAKAVWDASQRRMVLFGGVTGIGANGVPIALTMIDGLPGIAGAGAAPPPAHTLTLSPNPARGGTRVTFALERAGLGRVTVHDLHGRRVATLVDGALAAGTHTVRWDRRGPNGSAMPVGMYFVRLDTGARQEAHRLVLLDP